MGKLCDSIVQVKASIHGEGANGGKYSRWDGKYSWWGAEVIAMDFSGKFSREHNLTFPPGNFLGSIDTYVILVIVAILIATIV